MSCRSQPTCLETVYALVGGVELSVKAGKEVQQHEVALQREETGPPRMPDPKEQACMLPLSFPRPRALRLP
jgi:hypothetical protein